MPCYLLTTLFVCIWKLLKYCSYRFLTPEYDFDFTFSTVFVVVTMIIDQKGSRFNF